MTAQNIKQNIYGLVLAGGSGTRLWPISRDTLPKQCVLFAENKTLLEITLDRIKPLVPAEQMCVVTTAKYLPIIQKIIGEYIYICEPEARNTAAAILLSVLEISTKNPNALLFFVPADHYISQEEIFLHNMHEALELADQSNKIVLLGIKPSYASTQYGYIETDNIEKYSVKNFYEKPDKITAENFIVQDNFFWNAGIFVGKASVFLQEFKQLAPDFMDLVERFTRGLESYAAIPALAFDKLILEKTKNRAVIPCNFYWSDLGSLENFIAAQQKNNPKLIEIGAGNNLVSQTKKLVIISGIDNLCIIDTDDLLLISTREQAEHIKNISEYLKNNGYKNYV